MFSKISPIKKTLLGIAAACVIISIITANNLASVMMLIAANNNNAKPVVQQNVPVQNNNSNVSPSQPVVEQNNNNNNTAPDVQDVAPTEDTNTSDTSFAEIAEMYNKAINNAKANAKEVIRVKDGATNYNNIVEAGGLSSAASSLMGLFMVESKDKMEIKNEAWSKDKLPPENAQAALTADGIASATCVEEGDYYILTITAKNEENPKSGGPGVGSLCGVIQEETITGSISSVPGLELSNIKIAYENVTTIAKIEKSTGNLVALTVDAPCILQLSAKLFVVSIDDAKVGIGVYTEYTLSY